MRVEIDILDNVHTQIVKGARIVGPCLSYPSSYFKQGLFAKEEIEYSKCLVKKGGYAYVGWLQRIHKFCSLRNIPIQINGAVERIDPVRPPQLPGIEFRPDQLDLIEKAVKRNGVVVSPTGSGKTVLALGLISAYPRCQVLFLCPNLTIMKQTATKLRQFGFRSVCSVGEGRKDINADIVVSTIQTFSRLDLLGLAGRFDIVVADEIHLATRGQGTVEKILSKILAPVRLGLTATLPESAEKRLVIEGVIGPVIGKLTIGEARRLEILAEPRIELLTVPISRETCRLRRYVDIYEEGIVANSTRNKVIAARVERFVTEDKSVIVFAVKIEHLERISEALSDRKIRHAVVQGSTGGQEREELRQSVEKGEVKAVVSSVVWREGVDIPSLGGIIFAGGHKAETPVIQACGRALRRTKDKDTAVIVDLLDPYRYLAEHAVARLQVYVKMGWL